MRKCYVFDVDGTLADCSHRLHHIVRTDGMPKDWTAFFAGCRDDAPIPHMIELARYLLTFRPIIYVSGRSDESRELTELWLMEHRLPPYNLYMRKAGDHRDDDILKIELLAEARTHGFDPIMAFDDRARVVAAWRAAGIPCAQVAPGDF